MYDIAEYRTAIQGMKRSDSGMRWDRAAHDCSGAGPAKFDWKAAVKRQDIAQASNPDLRGSLAAMKRAAELARSIAIQTDTEIVVVRDGKTVLIPAKQLREERS